MKFDRQKGNVELGGELQCPVCLQTVPRKTRDQVFCSRKCWKVRYFGKGEVDRRHYQRSQPKQGTSAPALKQSCAALEAQLTALNRDEWPDIIARFGCARVPGYRDLARLTREVVSAKLRLPPY